MLHALYCVWVNKIKGVAMNYKPGFQCWGKCVFIPVELYQSELFILRNLYLEADFLLETDWKCDKDFDGQ